MTNIDRLEKMINEGKDDLTIRPDGEIVENTVTAAPANTPLMEAWKKYQATNAYDRSLGWALRIAPIVYTGARESEVRQSSCELMPFEQRKTHVEGALWRAFVEGFEAGVKSK